MPPPFGFEVGVVSRKLFYCVPSGVLGVDRGIKGRVPALIFDLNDRDSISQSNICPFALYKTKQKQSNNPKQ